MEHHYDISQDELQTHPTMNILRKPEALSIYEAAYREGRDFLRSTSGWSSKHLEALRVVHFSNFPVHRLCPAWCIVLPTSDLAQQVIKAFSVSAEDVKAGRYDMLSYTNWFYNELSTLLRTDRKTPSPVLRDAQPRASVAPFAYVSPPDKNSDSILGMSLGSSTDDSNYSPMRSPRREVTREEVDTREVVTNNMIVAFLSLLGNLAYPERNPTKTRPEFNALHDAIRFTLLGTSLTSENDGSGWKMRFSRSEKQWVSTGGAPLITIEVRSLYHLSNRKAKRNFHRLSPFEILAQEVGKLLATLKLKYAKQGFTNEKQVRGPKSIRLIFEGVYCVSPSHRNVHINCPHLREIFARM
jgi:hypothetical protein